MMEDQRSTVESFPQDFVDREGRRIRLSDHNARPEVELPEELRAMYLDLDGSCRALGIPPVREDELEEWLRGLQRGQNILAWHENRVVGHVGILPDGTGDYELAIFVHQTYQDAGIGTQLCRSIINVAHEIGVRRIWLSVACDNSPATQLFHSIGFDVVTRTHSQLTMELHLGEFAHTQLPAEE